LIKGKSAIVFFVLCIVYLPLPVPAGEPPASITGKDGAEMVLVPAGEFVMGSNDVDIKEVAPRHKVHVNGFYMDKYEVTIELFVKFLNAVIDPEIEEDRAKRYSWVVIRNDIEFPERGEWWPTEIIFEDGKHKAFEGLKTLPVVAVGWDAAQSYCLWVQERLPTEAEWERAARGGLEGKDYPWGDEIPIGGVIFGRKWIDNHLPPPMGRVGNYLPNRYGLFDMAGNVWEWCYDWYDPKYYRASPRKNPLGPESGTEKVLRGGSWFNGSLSLRVAHRNFAAPSRLHDAVGFRCVKDIKEEVE
jgi:formylglycine-generating enzyme required for sulfatase activity